ncbi:HNH endonuclease, partial [Amycolatopsis echigonensis]|nr:HNH endonuclease [Amycolatopsis echigonensis]
ASADKAAAAYLRVDKIARSLKTGDEKRTLDQLRADVAIDLLLSGKGGVPEQTEVYLYVDLKTYLGLNDNPAELAGHGHIPAELARHIATGPDTIVRRVITDPLTGQVIEVGKFRYRPSIDVEEFVRVRDRECRQPGCPRPAQNCLTEPTGPDSADADSTLSYCLRHRRLKNRADWSYEIMQDGKLIVTTPTGEKAESAPPPLHDPQPTPDQPEEERLGA